MEINVTHLVARHETMIYYSASCAEIGQDAGRVTWENSMDAVEDTPLVNSPEAIEECKDWFVSTGGWTREEVNEWSDHEVNALLLQFVAGDIRQFEDCLDDKAEMERRWEREGGSLYPGDDGQWWYYIGN